MINDNYSIDDSDIFFYFYLFLFIRNLLFYFFKVYINKYILNNYI